MSLQSIIQQIKTATLPGENTALRVGSAFEQMDTAKRNISDSLSASDTIDMINAVKLLATTGTPFLGTIDPATVIPAGNFWAFAGEGTYANANGIVVGAGEIAIITRVDTTFDSVILDVPVKSIDTIEKTSTVGLVDTYTITYTDGSTPSTFEVTNGNEEFENLFTYTIEDIVIEKINPNTEFFGAGAFGGYGSLYSNLQDFHTVEIKVRDSENIAPTQVKLRIREDNYTNAPILEQILNVDFSVNKTQVLSWSFSNIENPMNKSLFIEIMCVDGKLSCFGDTNTTDQIRYTSTINAADLNAQFPIASVMNIEIIGEGKNYKIKKSVLPIDVEISLPETITAVVGDTLQLFYRGIVKAVNPYDYDIVFNCTKGNVFPRYFEYSPQISDIGTSTLTVSVKDNMGTILTEKICQLITKDKLTSPSTKKNICIAGDSLMSNGLIAIEANRRLTGSGGLPTGEGLSNIGFYGRQQTGNTGYFGAGGWTWYNFIIEGESWWKITVTGVVSLSYGQIYKDSNGNDFSIREVNVTSGSGYITVANVTGNSTPTGILTRQPGSSGDDTIIVNSAVSDPSNPFWHNGALDFVNYANQYIGSGENIDYLYMLVNWNGKTPNQVNFDDTKSLIRTFADAFHAQFPLGKLKLIGIQLPSLNGGLGGTYGANGGYSETYGMVSTAFNLNIAYEDLSKETAYSSFVEFVNVSSQFDSENNMPEISKSVNTRSSKTELIGNNGVHPKTDGYYQISDVVYRDIVKSLS